MALHHAALVANVAEASDNVYMCFEDYQRILVSTDANSRE